MAGARWRHTSPEVAVWLPTGCLVAASGFLATIGPASLMPLWLAACALGVACSLDQSKLVRSLSHEADRDPLTGLLNRGAFHRALETELSQRRVHDRGLSLILIDVDDFKKINDRHGHLGGDMTLERVAGVINTGLRRGDFVGRVGGDEFALVLSGAGSLEALAVADRIRHRLEASFEQTATDVTLSMGIASALDHGASSEELLRAADEAMYVAKKMGKDRAAIYNAETVQWVLKGMPAPVPEPSVRRTCPST